MEAKLVEVGAWRTGNQNIWIDEEMVKNYLTHQEVLDYMQSVSNLEDSDEIGYNTKSYRTWETPGMNKLDKCGRSPTREKIVMFRKDYVVIAEAIREVREEFPHRYFEDLEITKSKAIIDIITDTLANKLAKENPKFDRAKFVKASKI